MNRLARAVAAAVGMAPLAAACCAFAAQERTTWDGPQPGTWTIADGLDTNGRKWTARIVLRKQEELTYAGTADWESGDGAHAGRETLKAIFDPRARTLILVGKSAAPKRGLLVPATYFATVAAGGRALTNGKWGAVGSAAAGTWSASWKQDRRPPNERPARPRPRSSERAGEHCARCPAGGRRHSAPTATRASYVCVLLRPKGSRPVSPKRIHFRPTPVCQFWRSLSEVEHEAGSRVPTHDSRSFTALRLFRMTGLRLIATRDAMVPAAATPRPQVWGRGWGWGLPSVSPNSSPSSPRPLRSLRWISPSGALSRQPFRARPRLTEV